MVSLLLRRPDLSALPDAPAVVETAGDEDAISLAALLNASFEESWDADRVRRDLLDDPTVYETFIIRDGSSIVATASARLLPDQYPDAGYVHWVASDPGYRGRGLGLAVTMAVLHRFAADGLSGSVLETDDDRLSAIKIYLGLGFIPQYRDDTHQERWSKIFIALAEHGRRAPRPAGETTDPFAAAGEPAP